MKIILYLTLIILALGCVNNGDVNETTTTTTTIVEEHNCDELKLEIEDLMEQSNNCLVDEDCVVSDYYPGCPFGCYLFVNKQEDLTALKEKINLYDSCPPQCEYKCARPPVDSELKCRQGKCKIKDTATTTSSTTTTTILQALEIPIEIESNCIGFLTGDVRELSLIPLAGGAWTRPHPGVFSWNNIEPTEGIFDFEYTDEVVENAQENDISLLVTLWPYANWDQENCYGSECKVSTRDQFYPREDKDIFGIPVMRCRPCSNDAYSNFIGKLVERYDGDGIDDMPGLSLPVKYWEVSNEPFIDDADEHTDGTLTFFIGSAEDYFELLKVTYSAVKAVCPDCKIVQGGAAHAQTLLLAEWRKVFEYGGTDYFDIANIHYLGSGDKYSMNVKPFKALLNEYADKPIWVTEAEIQSKEDLDAMTQGTLDAGATRIFYTGMYIHSGKDQKKSAGPQYSVEFKKMNEKC